MIRITHLFLILLFSSHVCFPATNPGKTKTVEVTYIANEGFLITTGDKTILIDAIFGDQEYGFCDIPDQDQIEAMRKAKADFSDIDLIASTHYHNDHFYADFVAEHLANNKNGKFLSSMQSMDRLSGTYYQEEIKDQLVEVTPDSLTFIDKTINGIDVRVYRLQHGPYYEDDPETGGKRNRHQHVQNLGFLFTVNGIKIFHSGDSSPTCIEDYKHFRLDREDIDIAFLGRQFIFSAGGPGIDVLEKYINPEHVVLMHIHHNHNPQIIEVAGQFKDEFSSIYVFETLMESRTYNF